MGDPQPLRQKDLLKVRTTLKKKYTVNGRPVTISRPAPKVVDRALSPIQSESTQIVKEKTENRINNESESDLSSVSENQPFESQYASKSGKIIDLSNKIILPVNERSMNDNKNKNKQTAKNRSSMEVDASESDNSFERPRKTTKITEKVAATPPAIALSNKFSLLKPDAQVPGTSSQGNNNTSNITRQTSINTANKKKWAPPIVIDQQVTNYKAFADSIRETIGSDKFSIKFGRGQVRVFVENMKDHEVMIQALDKDEAIFHSFMNPETKSKKIVLKAAPNMNANDIIDYIKEQNIAVSDCIPMRNKSNNDPFSYLISVPSNVQINDVRKINNLGNLRVSWERYTKYKNYTQCHRCQAFGHGEVYCYRKPRCVKCLDSHHTKNCTLQKTANSTPRCVNCLGNHTANYSKCPTLLDYLEKRQQQTQITQPQYNQRDTNINNQGNVRQNNNNTSTRRGNIKYSDVVRGSQSNLAANQRSGGGAIESENTTELRDVLKELKEINDLVDVSKFLQLLKQLKEELKQCKSTTDKMMVLLRYVEIFD